MRNPRYYGAGGWKAREAMRRLCWSRAAGGEVCAICGRPVDVDAPQLVECPDGKRRRAPWSMEVDEVIPISRGGSPTDPANVRPVHRICNERRGARMDGPDDGPDGAPALAHATATGEGAARW